MMIDLYKNLAGPTNSAGSVTARSEMGLALLYPACEKHRMQELSAALSKEKLFKKI
jgi:hypothetical protein